MKTNSAHWENAKMEWIAAHKERGHAQRTGSGLEMITIQTQLLGSLRSARAMGTYERRLQQLVKVPLLIVDDFGLKLARRRRLPRSHRRTL